MEYKKLAETYEKLSSTTKRLEKTEILSKFLMILSGKEKDIMHLLLGNIYPEYDNRKIGISNQLAIKAISMACGGTPKEVVKKWKDIGDLGKVAFELVKTKKQSTLTSHALTTKKVLENLRKLPKLEGKGTVNKKLSYIVELLTSASPLESKYLIRTLIGDLRIGVLESTIRDAMSLAFFDKDKQATQEIQGAIDKINDIAEVFEISKKKDIKEFDKITLQVGKPGKVMLCQKVANIQEGFKALGTPCAIEYKYDGFRIIIHKKEGEVLLFTRQLENVTKQFPEITEYVLKYVKGKSFILDSEAVGFDKKNKKYTDFQKISQRIRRKYDIEKLQKELPVEINIFDILYYNGKSLLNEGFKKRSELLRKIIKDKPYKIIASKQIITDSIKKAEKFYKKSLKDNQEGIIMKNLESKYTAGRKVGNMVKLKPEERDFDLVITGAEYGTGKRKGWLSSFILSCKRGGDYLEVGKVGTGIKEKSEQGISFDNLTELLKPLIIKEKGKSVKIKPKIIVAVTYQDIQKSPNYKSGFALRFPRFTAIRPDKHLSEINTLEDVKDDFLKQRMRVRKFV
jgi:DNA ligase-1